MILFYLSTFINSIKVAIQYMFSKIVHILRRFATVYNLLMLIVNICMVYQFSLNLCTLIYIDSIYYIIDFIKNSFNKKISDNQVLINNSGLYKTDSLNRYFYYLSTSVLYTYLKYFVFNAEILFLKYIFGLLIVPFIFNDYIYPKLWHIFDKISIKKTKLIKKICSEQIASAIIQLNKIYIANIDLIDKDQLVNKLMTVTNIQTNIYMFIKNTVATILMMKLRKSSTFYYKLTKYAYVYNSGDYLQNINLDEAKNIYIDTIKYKKYDEMVKPMFIQSVIYLYYSQNTGNYFETVALYLRYKLVICLSLLTLATFISGTNYKIAVIIGGSLFINFTRRLPLERKIYATKIFKRLKCNILDKYLDDRDVFSIITTIASGFITDKTLFISVINQFSGILLVNDVVNNMLRLLYRYIQKKIPNIILYTHYDNIAIVKYICTVVCHIIFDKYKLPYSYTLHIFPCFMFDMDIHRYIFPMMLSGLANNDNIIKLLLFAYILGVIDNVLTCRKLIIIKSPQIKTFGGTAKIYDNYCEEMRQPFMLDDIGGTSKTYIESDDDTNSIAGNIIDDYVQNAAPVREEINFTTMERIRTNSSVGSSTSDDSVPITDCIVRTESVSPKSEPMHDKTYRLLDRGYESNPFYDK
jgi:hypothetical protein